MRIIVIKGPFNVMPRTGISAHYRSEQFWES
jgi:hypothetical protein